MIVTATVTHFVFNSTLVVSFEITVAEILKREIRIVSNTTSLFFFQNEVVPVEIRQNDFMMRKV